VRYVRYGPRIAGLWRGVIRYAIRYVRYRIGVSAT
jgi:hypothetical protein